MIKARVTLSENKPKSLTVGAKQLDIMNINSDDDDAVSQVNEYISALNIPSQLQLQMQLVLLKYGSKKQLITVIVLLY